MSSLPAGPVLADVLAWAGEHLPHYFEQESPPFHRELFRDLAAGKRRLVARVAPRGHGKSTCAALAWPLYCICHALRRNIVIITHESALARQFVRDIRHELESNERILAAHGELCSPELENAGAAARSAGTKPGRTRRRTPRTRWSQTLLTTSSGITVQAKGVGGSLRGTRVGPHRPDLIICDDIEKDEIVRSAAGRRRLEHWMRRVVMPALAPGGQLIVLGSLLHHDSLLANLGRPQHFPGWDFRVYRAIEALPAQAANADAAQRFELVALWPQRWPIERLEEERRRIGTLAFEQEYMGNVVDDERRVFRPEWLRPYDPERVEFDRLVPLMAVDPATGKVGKDYFALWVGGLDPRTGTMYTRVLTLERINVVEQLRRIVQAWRRHRPIRIGIETNGYQVALKDLVDQESRRLGQYIPTAALTSVGQKAARIEALAPLLENGTFRLPPDLPAEVERQFLQFPATEHDDALDVCALAVELARSVRAGQVEIARAPGPRSRGREKW